MAAEIRFHSRTVASEVNGDGRITRASKLRPRFDHSRYLTLDDPVAATAAAFRATVNAFDDWVAFANEYGLQAMQQKVDARLRALKEESHQTASRSDSERLRRELAMW